MFDAGKDRIDTYIQEFISQFVSSFFEDINVDAAGTIGKGEYIPQFLVVVKYYFAQSMHHVLKNKHLENMSFRMCAIDEIRDGFKVRFIDNINKRLNDEEVSNEVLFTIHES